MSVKSFAQYTSVLDFAGVSNGNAPRGPLISDGTFLYGTTYLGGTSNLGTIFKIKPDGTGFVNLLNFNGAANGNYPFGSLISDGTFLYGMTSNGGTNDLGTIFKIKKDGTGYITLLNFNGANGRTPYGSLISDGTFLYGMTFEGGANGLGTIFKIMPNGTGYAKLLDFTGMANGSYPYGSLIYDGTLLLPLVLVPKVISELAMITMLPIMISGNIHPLTSHLLPPSLHSLQHLEHLARQ